LKLTDNTNTSEQISVYNNHLNLVVGVLIFSISLACLSFDNPQKVALFALPIVLGLIIGIEKYFPENIRIIRKLLKETSDPQVKKELRVELKQYMNFGFFLNNVVFLWGYIAYFAILLLPEYSEWLKRA